MVLGQQLYKQTEQGGRAQQKTRASVSVSVHSQNKKTKKQKNKSFQRKLH